MSWEMKKYPMYYGGVKQTYPNVPAGAPIFSRAVKVGNLIFLTGMSGRTLNSTWDSMEISDKIEDQVIVSLNKLRGAVEEAGSSMNNFVKTSFFIKNLEDAPRVWKTVLEYYQKHAPLLVEEPPVSNVIHHISSASLMFRGEIAAIAVESQDSPNWETKKYPMYWGGVNQTYPNVALGIPMLSKSVVVGNLIYVSDMDGRDLETGKILSEGIKDQTVVALDKIRFALGEAGSSMNNLIKINFYVRDLEDLPHLQNAILTYYQEYAPFLIEKPPISAIMQPESLANLDCLVEMEAIAVQSRDRPDWEMIKHTMQYSNLHEVYTRSVVVGNLVFCANVNPQNPETMGISSNFEDQMIICLDKIRFALEEAGSSMNNMFFMLMALKDMKDYSRMRKTELQYYQKYAPLLVEEPPISGPLQFRSLTRPEYLIEMGEVMGVISR